MYVQVGPIDKEASTEHPGGGAVWLTSVSRLPECSKLSSDILPILKPLLHSPERRRTLVDTSNTQIPAEFSLLISQMLSL